MRPIDADKLEERFSIECVGECGCCPHNKHEEKSRNESRYFFQETYTVEYCDLIRNAPTIQIYSRASNNSLNETTTLKGEKIDGERE